MLIDNGAAVMEKDNGGDGPMHWAAKRGFMKIMCTMRSAGACPKLPGMLYFFKVGDLSHFQISLVLSIFTNHSYTIPKVVVATTCSIVLPAKEGWN